jgi:hypothetical protein
MNGAYGAYGYAGSLDELEQLSSSGGAVEGKKGKKGKKRRKAIGRFLAAYLTMGGSEIYRANKKLKPLRQAGGYGAPENVGTTLVSYYEGIPQWWRILGMVAWPLAMGLSYSKNKSVGWALLHGFVAMPYLVYFAATKKKG